MQTFCSISGNLTFSWNHEHSSKYHTHTHTKDMWWLVSIFFFMCIDIACMHMCMCSWARVHISLCMCMYMHTCTNISLRPEVDIGNIFQKMYLFLFYEYFVWIYICVPSACSVLGGRMKVDPLEFHLELQMVVSRATTWMPRTEP